MPLRLRPALVLALVLSLGVPAALRAQAAETEPSDPRALARAILAEMVAIRTTDSAGHTDQAARAAERRLLAAGFPAEDVRIVEVTPGKFSLVARYRGTAGSGLKPVLMLAHMDVVDAWRQDWSFEPFELREQDGWYYGRGATDNKAGVATLLANFIRWKREGWTPARDFVMALTADEETSSDAIKGLVTKYRELVDAEYALNTDAGGGELHDGRPRVFTVQSAEKTYQTFTLEVRDRGGHSSVPQPSNAIYRLAAGLERLARFRFPVHLNETTRAYFERSAATQAPALARDMRAVARSNGADTAAARRLAAAEPLFNALLRTTCVATRLAAGHADNALPQSARATVNCRILPNEAIEATEATLRRVLADTAIQITRAVRDVPPGPASPLRADVMGPIERLAAAMWPGVTVVPEMSTGATDGGYARSAGIPTYGVSAVFDVIDDVRAHGRDERIGVKAFEDAVEFWYRLGKAVGTLPNSRPPA
ncbi:MAG TPA: M20/M25/M40 family metallo-hydrolase [Gemmatimonadales bacterium]|nr:M20/M25/M40 family metallo-hydrolase [Gemmatimonadales bacterium]